MQLSTKKMVLDVGSRASNLAQVQVEEILREIRKHHPEIEFKVHLMTTVGDRDRDKSLRDFEKTDFFTKEIDEAVLQGKCRIGIHSAKDLPATLPNGLEIVCVTKGLTDADSLVMKEGTSFAELKKGAMIATSSLRREENVRKLRSDLRFCDMRGTVEERLALLEKGNVDGVVIAEAALIRLGLTGLNRVNVPGETAVGQGKLAVVARTGDSEVKMLFKWVV